MSKFKYELTQILTLIYQAKKDQLLTEDERKSIKEFIISNEPDLTVEMERYNKKKDLKDLVETLKLLAGLTAMSSPLDTNLLKSKHRNQKRKKMEEKKKNEEQKVEMDENNMGLTECEIGNSPTIMPRTLKKHK